MFQDQYMFIHDVLRDVSICGITEIHSQDIGARLLVISDNDPETSRRRYDEFDVSNAQNYSHTYRVLKSTINQC
jgi:uncharacterized protein (DUF2249 family)